MAAPGPGPSPTRSHFSTRPCLRAFYAMAQGPSPASFSGRSNWRTIPRLSGDRPRCPEFAKLRPPRGGFMPRRAGCWCAATFGVPRVDGNLEIVEISHDRSDVDFEPIIIAHHRSPIWAVPSFALFSICKRVLSSRISASSNKVAGRVAPPASGREHGSICAVPSGATRASGLSTCCSSRSPPRDWLRRKSTGPGWLGEDERSRPDMG